MRFQLPRQEPKRRVTAYTTVARSAYPNVTNHPDIRPFLNQSPIVWNAISSSDLANAIETAGAVVLVLPLGHCHVNRIYSEIAMAR